MPSALCVGVKIIFDQILQNSVWLGKKNNKWDENLGAAEAY